jgi:two-component system CheB/CheR fusion protein
MCRGGHLVCSKATGSDGSTSHTATDPTHTPVGAPRHARPRRILLLEDHVDTAAMMRRLLERRGYHVVVAFRIAEATAALRSESFDLLLADLVLPDGCGLDLMRDLSRTSALPGIALSGHAQADDIRRSREAGFADHQAKPVNLERLWASMDRVLAMSKLCA